MNMTSLVNDLRDRPIKDQYGDDLTLGNLIIEAIAQNEQSDTGKEKYMKYEIGRKALADNADFSSKEVRIIKECIGNAFSPIIVGSAYDLIDAQEEEIV